jgi:hypothetical protein
VNAYISGRNNANEQKLNLFDGDLATTVKATVVGIQAWIDILFDRPYYVTQIFIYQIFFNDHCEGLGSNHCLHSLEDYKICKKRRKNIQIDVYMDKNKVINLGELVLNDGPELENQTYTFDTNIIGDKLILVRDTGTITISEVIIVGTPASKISRFLSHLLINRGHDVHLLSI